MVRGQTADLVYEGSSPSNVFIFMRLIVLNIDAKHFFNYLHQIDVEVSAKLDDMGALIDGNDKLKRETCI